MFVIITQDTLKGFAHPALDLMTGEIIELAAEPGPVQLELFTARPSLPATVEFAPDE